jgi:hypothetical protein
MVYQLPNRIDGVAIAVTIRFKEFPVPRVERRQMYDAWPYITSLTKFSDFIFLLRNRNANGNCAVKLPFFSSN